MKDMVEELFHGNLGTEALHTKKDSDYHKLHKEIIDIMEVLAKSGDSENLDKLSDLLDAIDAVTGYAYFSIGFRWGAQMAVSMLATDNSTFEY